MRSYEIRAPGWRCRPTATDCRKWLDGARNFWGSDSSSSGQEVGLSAFCGTSRFIPLSTTVLNVTLSEAILGHSHTPYIVNIQCIMILPKLWSPKSSSLFVFVFRLKCYVSLFWPPLWSSGQTSWLQIRRSGFDFRHYQKKKAVGLERGPLSLVSTTEELLDRKVVAPV
jgi:hypothetical protein